jgi:hypothetical protein
VLVHCLDGFEARFDCAAFGAICRDRGPTAMCAFGTECSDDQIPVCSGADLLFCEDGVPATVDCQRLGFYGCELPEAGIRLVGSCVK